MDFTTVEHHMRISIKTEAPAAYRAMAAFDRSIELDPALRELIKIRASQLNGCAYCIDMHTRAAREAGESEQRLYALAAWRESPLFTLRERAALELTDAITGIGKHGVPRSRLPACGGRVRPWRACQPDLGDHRDQRLEPDCGEQRHDLRSDHVGGPIVGCGVRFSALLKIVRPRYPLAGGSPVGMSGGCSPS